MAVGSVMIITGRLPVYKQSPRASGATILITICIGIVSDMPYQDLKERTFSQNL